MLYRENKQQFSPFPSHLKNESKCIEYLLFCKWGSGYKCRKCGHLKYGRGKKWHHRRCTKCRYDESPTARTLFHKIKFPLNKAFGMVNELVVEEEGRSSIALSKKYRVCQETAWFFKRKVQQAMARFETKTFIPSTKKIISVQNRSLLGKNMLIETQWDRVTRIDLSHCPIPSTNESQNYIATARSVLQKKHCGIVRKRPPNEVVLRKHKLARGAFWKQNLVFGTCSESVEVKEYRKELDAWVRKTHFHISKKHLFYYCCEFNFRKWKKVSLEIGPKELIQSMVLHPWLRFAKISAT
jgi:hypothetical protein